MPCLFRRKGLGRLILLETLKEGIASRRSIASLHVDVGHFAAALLPHFTAVHAFGIISLNASLAHDLAGQ
jgi:hypothetical protein